MGETLHQRGFPNDFDGTGGEPRLISVKRGDVLPEEIQPITRGRITTVSSVCYQWPGSNPIQFETRSYRWLEEDVQPWERRCKATEEWQPIELGWLDGHSVCMIGIINQEGRFPHRLPSEEQKAEAARKILEIGTPELFWRVHPGESFHGDPSSISNLKIRCQSGEAKFLFYAIPG